MKKIKVVQVLEHKNYPVYIRKLDTRFEFLVFYNNKLYSQYFNIKPSWYRRYYKKEQLDNIINLVYFSACETIDALEREKQN